MRLTIQEALRVLEITVPLQELDEETLKKQYKKMARKYHPDVNKSDDAEEMFKKVNQAKDILEKAIKAKNNQSDMFGMFRDFFTYATAKSRIQPIIVNISLDLREQYYGGEKEIKYKRRVVCRICNGTGCNACNGQGFTIKDEKVKINIQPGLNPDANLVFKEVGHEYTVAAQTANVNTIIAGDVVLKVNLDTVWIKNKDVKFERQNHDLIIHEKIRYIDFLKKYHSGELDDFEVELFEKGDTVKFTKFDHRLNGYMIIKPNLGFKPDYRSRTRGSLIYMFDIDWSLEENDVVEIQNIYRETQVALAPG